MQEKYQFINLFHHAVDATRFLHAVGEPYLIIALLIFLLLIYLSERVMRQRAAADGRRGWVGSW